MRDILHPPIHYLAELMITGHTTISRGVGVPDEYVQKVFRVLKWQSQNMAVALAYYRLVDERKQENYRALYELLHPRIVYERCEDTYRGKQQTVGFFEERFGNLCITHDVDGRHIIPVGNQVYVFGNFFGRNMRRSEDIDGTFLDVHSFEFDGMIRHRKTYLSTGTLDTFFRGYQHIFRNPEYLNALEKKFIQGTSYCSEIRYGGYKDHTPPYIYEFTHHSMGYVITRYLGESIQDGKRKKIDIIGIHSMRADDKFPDIVFDATLGAELIK